MDMESRRGYVSGYGEQERVCEWIWRAGEGI